MTLTFPEAVAELEGRRETRMIPDLSRILRLATLLDDPQLRYPSIHVTGTNGKGTAASVANALACAHGLTAGLYTSPHLLSVTERFSVCGEDIAPDAFAEEYDHLLPFLILVDRESEDRVTYFETLTALAYLWFADKPVGLGVFEVGMGGTWDATNLVSGDVAVITPIDLDHPELGPTVTDVAREKAGIIKEGKTAVVREQHDEAQRVIDDRCADVGAALKLELRDWELDERLQAVGGQSLRVRGLYATYEDLHLPLYGEHAARNAAASLVALEALLGTAVSEDASRRALASVRWPGRMEVVAHQPTLVLDGAHNPAAAAALVRALVEAFVWRRLHLVIAVSGNKDVGGVVAELARVADIAYVARNERERSGDAEPLAAAFEAAGIPTHVSASIADALAAARAAAGEDDLILVTGSLYTVADARRAVGA
jgi:dihydrofolate synthase / folylpolyglutamate synthase